MEDARRGPVPIGLRVLALALMISVIVGNLIWEHHQLGALGGLESASLEARIDSRMAVYMASLHLESARITSAGRQLPRSSPGGGQTPGRGLAPLRPAVDRARTSWRTAGILSGQTRSLEGAATTTEQIYNQAEAILVHEGAYRDAAALAVYLGKRLPVQVLERAPNTEEADLWRHLSGDRVISPAIANRLTQLSSGWRMGWYRTPLLEAIDVKAGRMAQASALQKELVGETLEMFLGILAVALVLLGACAVGVILFIPALIFWRSLHKEVSPLAEASPLALIESAVFWVFLMACAGGLAESGIFVLKPATGPAAAAISEVVIGLAGVLFMRWWLAKNGFKGQVPSLRPWSRLIRDAGWGLLGYCCIIPWTFAAAGLSLWLFRASGPSKTPDNPAVPLLAHSRDPLSILLMFTLACVLAPFVEERFFRGAIYPALRQKLPVWAAAAITGIIFGAIHPQIPLGFLPLAVVGAGFCLLYELRGTTASSIVAHGIHNGVVLCAVLIITR